MAVIDVFTMPTGITITGRSSSITNAFVNAIIPSIMPSEAELLEALNILGLDPTKLTCAYCGDPATEWDHLRPLVRQQRPTGYISEIANLVPACGKCNQSKGALAWHVWITSSARLSPTSRGVPDLSARIERLKAFERWRQPTRIDFEAMVPAALWEKHWENHKLLLALLKECQATADKIRTLVQ